MFEIAGGIILAVAFLALLPWILVAAGYVIGVILIGGAVLGAGFLIFEMLRQMWLGEPFAFACFFMFIVLPFFYWLRSDDPWAKAPLQP